MPALKTRMRKGRHWLKWAGALVFGGLALGQLLDMRGLSALRWPRTVKDDCQQAVQPSARLSRGDLAQFLTIPEGDTKQRVRAVVREPFCQLGDLQLRQGATAQREAYPLEFDRQTWLVVLYEQDQYVGFEINAR